MGAAGTQPWGRRAGSDLLRVGVRLQPLGAEDKWLLLLDSGRKNPCSRMVLSRLCSLKKAISCGYFFEDGWKPHLYLVTHMLAKVNFIF